MDDQTQRRGPGPNQALLKILVTLLLLQLGVPMLGAFGVRLLYWWGDHVENPPGEADSPPQPSATSEAERADPGPPWEELAAEPVFELEVPDAEPGEITGETGVEHLHRDRSMPSRAERVWQVNDGVGDEIFIDVANRLRDHGGSFTYMVSDEASARASGTVPVDLPTRPRAGAGVQWATFTLTYEPKPGHITLKLSASYRRPPYAQVYGEQAGQRSVGDECPPDAVEAAGMHDAPRSPAERREEM